MTPAEEARLRMRLAALEADTRQLDAIGLAKRLKAAQCPHRELKQKRKTEDRMHITIHPLRDNFIAPRYKTKGAAAFDLYLQDDLYLTPGEPASISLGFSADIEDGYSVQIIPRSSAGMNWGIRQWTPVGLIGSDYKGEWCAVLESAQPVQFRRGDRLLQAFVTWSFRADGIDADDAERGTHSGSTGR